MRARCRARGVIDKLPLRGPRQRRCVSWLLARAVLFAAACVKTTEPPTVEADHDATCPVATPCLVVTGMSGSGYSGAGRGFVVDVTRGSILGRFGPEIWNPSWSGLSTDSLTIVISGSDTISRWVRGIDVHSGRIEWAHRLYPDAASGVSLLHPSVTVLSANKANVTMCSAINGEKGLVNLSVATGLLAGFLPVDCVGRRLTVLAGRGAFPAGTMLVVGSRAPSTVTAIYFISPALEVLDSIAVPAGSYEAALAPDEHTAFVVSRFVLAAIDLATRTTVHSVAMPRHHKVTVSDEGDRVFAWSIDYQEILATGLLLEFTPQLVLLRSLPLSQPLDQGSPPSVQDMVVEPGGQRAFLLTGTGPGLSTIARAVIRVLDLDSGKLSNSIPLGEYPHAVRMHYIPR